MNAFPLLSRSTQALVCRAAWILRRQRSQRITAPIAVLLAMLQRAPAERVIAITSQVAAGSPIGSIVRSALLATASLGTIHSLAGATTLSPTTPSPMSTTVGANVQIGFTVLNTINIGSWRITGTLPPGLTMSAREGGNSLTGPGTLDATTPGMSDGYGGTTDGNATTTPVLTGKPTQAGSYTFSLQAFELGHLSGLASNTFDYTINVTGSGSTDAAPTISTQPQSQTVTAGASVTFSVTATGSPTPTYQWRKDSADLSGATNASLSLTNVQSTNAGTYTVVVTNTAGNVTSTGATLTVNAATSAPTFTTQPQSQIVNVGASVTFTVAASGSPTPTYQWRKDNADISGATGATLSLTNVQTTNAGTYTAVATNSAGSLTSTGATLTVNVVNNAPTFTLQPTSMTIATNNTVVFNAAASGATSLKWQRNGADVSGATSGLLVIGNASSANAGTYTCIATNSSGSTTSSAAGLTVTNASAADTGHLINLSVRTNSGTGDQVLGTGFVIGGADTTGTKPVLIRVTGPALATYGVPGWMLDPTLKVQPLGSSTVVGQNDNWGGDATIMTTSNAVGAFPLVDTASKDAAVVLTLNGGGYTTLAIGANNTTGAVLTEVYDATPSSSITATTPRLINVSARAQVNAGDDVLYAGFVLGGSTAKTVLIRATGPALAGYGVGGALVDPKMELYQLNGPKLYENDNWGGSTTLINISNSVGAFPILDTNSKDAVLLVTLPPGGYSAKVSGVNNGTGVGLVEVYEVP